jgi:Family of unknown function (DUF6356)
MKSLLSAFTEHPASVGETYFQHLGSATSFALRMFGAGLCCLVHGFFPFLFVRTGSNTVTQLHDRMVLNRDRRLRTANRDASEVPAIGAS